MKRSLLIAAAFALTALSACKKDKPAVEACPSPGCFGPNICTRQFSQVFIHVYTADGGPAVLDSFVVTDAAGIPLPPYNGNNVWGYVHGGGGQASPGILPGGCILDSNGINGAYSIINDGWVPEHQNTKTSVWAKGFIGGHAVFSEPYVIAADCCTASKYAGKDVITLQ